MHCMIRLSKGSCRRDIQSEHKRPLGACTLTEFCLEAQNGRISGGEKAWPDADSGH